MKRMTSEEVLRYVGTGGISGPVVDDWLQAREDVKWLAGQLQRLICNDPTCTACVEDRARLAEVAS